MKLIEISSCRQCKYMKEYLKSMPRCMWPNKLPQRNLKNSYVIPDWCPLPDAYQQTVEDRMAKFIKNQEDMPPEFNQAVDKMLDDEIANG